jgi:hypothetical protein
MLRRSLLGLLAILTGTSCVPEREVRSASAPVAIAPAEAELLQKLALVPPEPTRLTAAPIIPTPRTGAPAFTPAIRSEGDAARALECLTAAVYYEARSEPDAGQRAVAQVVLNRVRDRAFPASVCGVVYQRTATVCQFSFACDGSMNRSRDYAAWARARAVAEAAYGGEVYAPVGGSTHFHTAAISPWWAPSLARVGQIGAHVFYGWRRAMAGALSFRRAYSGFEPGSVPKSTLIAATAEDTMGVTVHRGDDTPAADPTEDKPTAPKPVQLFASGVRIHRDAMRPAVTTGAYGATVGPEEAPDAI